MFTVGLAALVVCSSSPSAQRVPPPATHLNRRARHTTVSVICARRPALAFLPATVCISHTSRMLRHRSAWRFATACTAHHGSFLPCSPVPLRCQRRCAGVCRPKRGHPGRSAQPSLQPTALSLRFSTIGCADRSWRLTPLYSSGGRLSFSVSRLIYATVAPSPPLCSLA
jgi:hypothetical protein